MSTPLVSVNIPTYNSARYIEETIGSVLSQTFTNFELLIVDDGSTDETVALAESFNDRRIKVFRQTNQGLGRTRNRLLELSAAEMIAFLDHDDRWAPTKLARQLERFAREPELAMVYTEADIVYETGARVRFSRFHPPSDGSAFEAQLTDFSILISSTMARKQVLLECGGFPPDYQVAEELVLFLEVAYRHSIGYIPEPLVDYRQHPGQGTRDLDRFVEELLAVYSSWRARGGAEVQRICDSKVGHVYYGAGRQALLRLEDPSRSRAYLFNAWRRGVRLTVIPFLILSFAPLSVIRIIRRLAIRSRRT